jgi:hypothetical protein
MYHKINYVCIVCSTTFTRKSSAIRHSVHIHAGTAFFVRLIDYIVGRMQGRYQPSNPLLYGQKKRNEKNLRNLHSMINCKNAVAVDKIHSSRFTVILDETKKDQYDRINSASQSIESDLKRETNSQKAGGEAILNDLSPENVDLYIIKRKKQYENNSLTPDYNSQFLEKYQELATFVRKYHTKEDANQILSRFKGPYLEGKDNLNEIDKWLEVFRKIDRSRSI